MKLKYWLVPVLLITLFYGVSLALTASDYFDQATTKYLLGNLEGAKSDLDSALSLDPNHQGAKELLSTVKAELSTKNSPSKTTSIKPSPSKISPTIPPSVATPPVKSLKNTSSEWLSQGIQYYNEGKYLPAKTMFEKVLKFHPGHAKATNYLILIKDKIIKSGVTGKAGFSFKFSQNIFAIILSITFIAVGGIALLVFLFVIIQKLKPHELIKNLRKKVYCPVCKTENPVKAEFCHKCGAKIKVWANISQKQQEWYARHHWKKNPFALNSLPELFTGHTAQVRRIIEKLHAKSGHILVMGSLGVGKTTLLKWLELHLRDGLQTLYISRPPKQFNDLIKLIASHLKIKTKGKELTIYNVGEYIKKTKKGLVLLLDEAHEFNPDIEQQLRTLGDNDDINFVIAGLMETADKFKKEFPPIYDRLVAELTLSALTLEETKELIKKRIKDAGGHDFEPFTPSALERIYEISKGIPRATLKTCDWVVTEAVREGHGIIDTPLMI